MDRLARYRLSGASTWMHRTGTLAISLDGDDHSLADTRIRRRRPSPPMHLALARQPEHIVHRRKRDRVSLAGLCRAARHVPSPHATSMAQAHDQFSDVRGQALRGRAELHRAGPGYAAASVQQAGEQRHPLLITRPQVLHRNVLPVEHSKGAQHLNGLRIGSHERGRRDTPSAQPAAEHVGRHRQLDVRQVHRPSYRDRVVV